VHFWLGKDATQVRGICNCDYWFVFRRMKLERSQSKLSNSTSHSAVDQCNIARLLCFCCIVFYKLILQLQGYESSLFLSYFKDGVRLVIADIFLLTTTSFSYLKGGHQSGFTHVVDQYDNWNARLFHCKGKRNVRSTQVSDCLGFFNIFLCRLIVDENR
jgi:hypothetical protein